ncbi:hypothetical protein M8J77_000462 [Diaphorina citri]|nr:hypothetical protein M8J77_000462 [Diaphorina citri]
MSDLVSESVQSPNYWTREDGHMIHESRKYSTDSSVGTPSYKVHMKLTIFSVTEKDFGTYKCVAKNPRGETDGTIRLYILYDFSIKSKHTSMDEP